MIYLSPVLYIASIVVSGLCGPVGQLAARAISPAGPGHWVGTWVSMPQLTETENIPPAPFNTTTGVFHNATLRTTVHVSVPGSQLRVRFSNVFGATPLNITAVTVALPANGAAGVAAIQPNTLQTLTFSGQTSFAIPNGAQVVSDPINFSVAAQSNLAVSVYLANGQAGSAITSHPGSRTTSVFAAGNHVSDVNMASQASVAHWYFLSAVEVWAPSTTSAFVIIGDSITDGRGSTDNQNDRWPDQLLALMQQDASIQNIAVLNQAAGGNRILADGLGPNTLGRIDRDVLAQSGVKFAMIFESVNDIGDAAATAAAQSAIETQLESAFEQMAARVRSAGIPFYGATITPFGGPGQAYDDAGGLRAATRQRVNDWVRNSGTFDAVFDFDAAVRDPSNPTRLRPDLDSGDHLHLNPAGYTIMAQAVPLSTFTTATTPKNFGFTRREAQ